LYGREKMRLKIEKTINENSSNLDIKSFQFYKEMNLRRSIRSFKNKKISISTIFNCISAAGTAPSGANRQPWQFVVVLNKTKRKQIRDQAEKEEKEFYLKKAGQEILEALRPLGTYWQKPHLEEASALIVIFLKSYDHVGDKTISTYYGKESVGIATGILITAFHKMGIDTLTHTPSPMTFLNHILDRPKNEKPFLIIAIGFRSDDYKPPEIYRKNLSQICTVLK
jgi:iodotyrosine deiodinase